MADFKFNKQGMADLEKQLKERFKVIEMEANRAASREETPERKAHAFAAVLRRHGVADVNEAELRRKFGG